MPNISYEIVIYAELIQWKSIRNTDKKPYDNIIVYGTLHALQSASAIIIEINGQMTELKKVMDEETNFDRMLQSSIENAEKFSVAIQDINTAMAGFAKMGFNEKEVIDLSGTAAALQQISDLTADDAMNVLASSMVQWNKTASESIEIADMLNEVDNRNSVSVVQLAQSMAKAGDTASTYGSSLERLLGYTTAIATTTRESGNVIGNGLKSIFSRIGSDDSIDALGSIGVEVKNVDGTLRSIDDVLDDVSSRWNNLNNVQQRSVGLAVAGTYQLTRFNALMKNYSIAIKASNEALNSEGSAMSEVAKRSDSLEARIVRMKNSWTELSLAIGESGLTNTLIGLMTALTNMAKFGVQAANSVGFLPVVLGTVVTAFILTNKHMADFIIRSKIGGVEVRSLSAGFTQLSLTAKAAAMSMNLAGKASKGLGIALRGLLSSTLIGAGLVVVGIAIEKLISSIAKHKKETADLEKEQNKITQSYGTQRKAIDELLIKHEQLAGIKKRSSEEEQEYLDTSTKLASLMPNLVDHIDSYGQAHLKSGEALKNELIYAKELVELSKRTIADDYGKKFDKSVDTRKKALDKMKDIQDELANPIKTYTQGGYTIVDVMSDDEKAKLEMKLRSVQREVANTNILIRDDVGEMITEILKLNDVDIDDTLSSQIADIVKTFDIKKLNPDELTKKAQEFSNAITSLKNGIVSSSHGMGIQVVADDLKAIAMELGYTEEQASAFVQSLIQQANAQSDVNAENQQAVIDQAALTKLYEDAVSSIQSLNGVMNELNDKQGVSADSMQFLMDKYPDLLQYVDDEKTLRIKLQEQIESEAEVARQAMLDKMSDSETFYSALIKNNSTMVNQFATDYGIDLKNFTSLAKAKAEVDNEVRSRMNKAWNNYYEDLKKKTAGTFSISVDGQAPVAVKLGYGSEGAKGTPYYDAFKDAEKISSDFDGITSGYIKSLTGTIPKTGLNAPSKDKEKKDKKDKVDNLKEINKILDESQVTYKQLDAQMEIYEARMLKQDELSKGYSQNLNNQLILLKKKKELAEKDIVAADTRLKSTKLTDEERKDLESRRADLVSFLVGIDNEIVSQLDKINEIPIKRLQKRLDDHNKLYSDEMSRLDYGLSLEKAKGQNLEVGSKEYFANIKNQSVYIKDKIKNVENEQLATKKLLETEKLSATQKSELQKRYKELNLEVANLNNEILDSEEAIRDNYKQVADQAIEAVKSVYEQRQKNSFDYYNKEKQRIDDLYDKEKQKIDDVYNAKLKLLDDQESQDDHNENLSKLQKEAQDIQSKINKFSLDDSDESKSRVLDLEKEKLAKIEEIEELQHKRSLELQRKSLQENQKLEEDNLKQTVKIIDRNTGEIIEIKGKSHEEALKLIDEEAKYWDDHYTELINDERHWASEREKIMNGNTTELSSLLSTFTTDVQTNMTTIGKSVQNNLIDKLKEASDALKVLNSTSVSNGSSTINTTPSSPTSEASKSAVTGTLSITQPINLWKRNGDKLEMVRVLNPNENYKVYGYDDKFGGQYNVGGGHWVTNMPSHVKLKQFKTGGYTGDWSGDEGKVAMLHKKELILNANQTEDILKSVSILDRFKDFLPKINMNALKPTSQGGNILQIDNLIHIDNIEKDANINLDKLVDDTMNKLVQKMKPYGFIR